MILVDVYAPALDRQYDFAIDEEAKVEEIIEELAELIAQREYTVISGNKEEFILCEKKSKKILEENGTLAGYGIKTGSRLILL